MKKISVHTDFRFFAIAGLIFFNFFSTHAQNAIVGADFSNGWGAGCADGNSGFTFFSPLGAGGTYSSNPLNANNTGNQFWRFGIDWSGTFAQRTISPGSNTQVFPGTKYTLSSTCTNDGALFTNVTSTSHNYIFKTLNAGTNPTGDFVFFRIEGDVRSVSGVTQDVSNPITDDNVVVTANLDGALATGQSVYLRYTTDGYASSTIVEMTGSGPSYSATIPAAANTYGTAVSYYTFTSGSGLTIASGDADLFTINLNNNGGSNYGYTPGFYRISPATPSSAETITLRFTEEGTDLSALPADEDVYVHMGAILEGTASTEWSVTKGNWGIGDGVGRLTETAPGSGIWEFSFRPYDYFSDIESIDDGNSNPDSATEVLEFDSLRHSIFRLGMVFRSTSGSLVVKDNGASDGADIYTDLTSGIGLLLSGVNPLDTLVNLDLAIADATYTFAGTTQTSSDLVVKVNNVPTQSLMGVTSFTEGITLATLGVGLHKLEVAATSGSLQSKTIVRYLNIVDSDSFVVLNPISPTASTEVTITFDALNTSLEGASKVYFHSAAITESPTSETWGTTVGNWGQDDGVGQMVATGNPNEWSITLTPETYYFPGGIDPNENIFRIAMVFRNADGTIQQKDINSDNDIYRNIDPGFYLSISSPSDGSGTVEAGSTFTISAFSSETADFTVDINTPIPYAETANNVTNINYDTSISDDGSYTLTITADNGSETKTKTAQINVFDPIISQDPPSGMLYGPNYDDNDPTKATLLLHMPTQGPISVVHVIGDFNNWTVSEAYKMKRSTVGDVWWLELTGLTPGQEYVYQYLVNGSVKSGDPYSDKVSDPDDQYISTARYPGLIAYPSDKTEFRATVLQTNQTPYQWQINDFERPELYKTNIYELLIRDFTDEGTYQGVIDRLDYIQNLGFNAIHLMPTSEFEGNESWGYNPNYYFASDKFYGPKDKLKELVDEAHKRGIAIIGDLVLNHAFYSTPFARLYWNEGSAGSSICAPGERPRSDNPWMNECHNFVDERAAWWGADFNHESTHTEALIDSITDYWMSEYRFDGFRFDFTKGFSNTEVRCPDCWGSAYDQARIDNLNRMKGALEAKHPGAYVIFEHLANADEDRILANGGVHMWGGASVTQRYERIVLGYDDTNTDLTNGVFDESPMFFSFANWMSYMESHDEERLAYELHHYGRQFIQDELDVASRDFENFTEDFDPANMDNFIRRLKLPAAINLLLPGARMVWQFGELGYDYSIDYNGRTGNKPVRWDYYDNPKRRELHDFYAKLLNLRKNHEVFHHLDAFDLGGGSWVKWMRFKHNGVTAIVLTNFQAWESGDSQNGSQSEFIDFNASAIFESCGGDWYEHVSDAYETLNLGTDFRLNAGDIKIYTNVAIDEEVPTQTSSVGDVTWGAEWDNSGITFSVVNAPTDESAGIYLDIDPVDPVNGGTNANGALDGLQIDNATIDPAFRADFVAIINTGGNTYHTDNGSNGWNGSSSGAAWTYAESNCSNRRTVTIPWSDITGGAAPASFNWMGYAVYNNTNTGTYGAMPEGNGFESDYGVSTSGPYDGGRAVRYYSVDISGGQTDAFAMNNYVHDGGVLTDFGSVTLGNFSMGGSGSISLATGASWEIANNFLVGTGATLNLNDATVTFNGTNFESSGTFNAQTSTVVIAGNSPTTITGDMTFHNLVINNAAGVTLAGNITITGTLTLTNGKITSTSSQLLIMSATSNVAGAGPDSYVTGPVRKVGNAAVGFTFPIGSPAHYAPIGIEAVANGLATDYFTAQYFDTPWGAGPGDRTVNTPTPGVFEAISSAEHWDLDRSAGSSMEARVRLFFRDFGRSGITDINNVLVAHYNGTEWVNEGGTPTNQTVRGSVLSNTLTSFSPLSSGGTTEVVTPVTLRYFEGRKEGGVNQLDWATATELNNSHFEVYRSFDGANFELIGEVEGANASQGAAYSYTDQQLGSGQYFYRLRQVDFDGQDEWFNTVLLEVVAANRKALEMFPNPLEQDRILRFNLESTVNESQELHFELMSLSGKSVYQHKLSSQSNQVNIRVPSHIEQGVYLVRVKYLGRFWTQKLLVK